MCNYNASPYKMIPPRDAKGISPRKEGTMTSGRVRETKPHALSPD